MTQTETKVLIADDHEIFRRGLLDALKAEPSLKVVGEAGDGERALRLAEELRPDVAVLDIKMPKADGLEVARRLRGAGLPVEVIILTMYDDPDAHSYADAGPLALGAVRAGELRGGRGRGLGHHQRDARGRRHAGGGR